MNHNIHCKNLEQVYNKLIQEESLVNILHTALEVHVDVDIDRFLLDVRTYLCSQGTCTLHYKRSHRRMSDYNMKKMKVSNNYRKIITEIANKIVEILNTQRLKINNKSKIKYEEGDKEKTSIQIVTDKTNLKDIEKCDYCTNKKLIGIKHVHFIKGENNEDTKNPNTHKIRYEPIETVFNKIDDIAENNNMQIVTRKPKEPPGKPILQTNSYRMSYGDINYLGNNKALLYFYRGIRGYQTFTNSMYPLEQQPKYKDLIVLDDIVFTATCKCDSYRQHAEMFPHYRVTCATGLTCPARLNTYERMSYISKMKASTAKIVTARHMLIRYWK